jgi:hypothetical protein
MPSPGGSHDFRLRRRDHSLNLLNLLSPVVLVHRQNSRYGSGMPDHQTKEHRIYDLPAVSLGHAPGEIKYVGDIHSKHLGRHFRQFSVLAGAAA